MVLLRPLCIVLQIGQGSLVGRLLSPEAASLLLLEQQGVRLILKTSGSLAPIYTL